MRLVVLAVALVVTIASTSSVGVASELSTAPPYLIEIRGETSILDIHPNDRKPNKENVPAQSPHKPSLRVRDLFLPDVAKAPPDQKKHDPINFEPWVPQRGSVGVRIEVTW